MKIAIGFPPGYQDTDGIDDVIQRGFRYIEICTMRFLGDEARQNRVIEYALRQGLEVSLHAPYGRNNIADADQDNREASIAAIKQAIDLAARYGLGAVTFHPGRLSAEDEDPEEKWELLTASAARIAAYAKEKKVFVGLENMERRKNEIVCTVADLNRFEPLARENPYFGVTLDFVHFSTLGDVPDLGELRLPIHDVHISQNAGGKTHRPLTEPGGTVDVLKVCRRLADCGYKGFAVLEMVEGWDESRDVMNRVLEQLS